MKNAPREGKLLVVSGPSGVGKSTITNKLRGDELSDQVRVMSPKDAISAGADFVVIGRSITGQWDGSDLKMRKKIELISNSLG